MSMVLVALLRRSTEAKGLAGTNWIFGTCPSGAGSAIAAQYLLFATWNRTLTQAEAALFAAAPFSMFRPVVRRTYYAPAAAPPTGTASPFLVNWGG